MLTVLPRFFWWKFHDNHPFSDWHSFQAHFRLFRFYQLFDCPSARLWVNVFHLSLSLDVDAFFLFFRGETVTFVRC